MLVIHGSFWSCIRSIFQKKAFVITAELEENEKRCFGVFLVGEYSPISKNKRNEMQSLN